MSLFAQAFFRDLRSSMRRAARDRGFALVTTLTLAICVGANAGIFTVVNSLLLRPLPFPEADRIVAFGDQYPALDASFSLFNSVPSYFDRLDAVPAVQHQAMFGSTLRAIAFDGRPEELPGLAVTPSLFSLLRVAPLHGRPFSASEGEVGNEQKVILSYRLWQRLFAGAPDVLGRQLRMSGESFEIVGVMPDGFSFFDPTAEYWIPLAFTEAQKADDQRLTRGFYHVGRLAPDASIEQARAQVDALNAANLERFPAVKELLINAGFHTVVTPLQDALVRDIAPTLYLLWLGAGFLLLVGGINLANFAVARQNARQRELATRLALGATRSGIARLTVSETLLLGIGGGVGSLIVGGGLLWVLQRYGADTLSGRGNVSIDGVVVAFALVVSAAVGLLIGIASAGSATRLNLNEVLTDEGRGGTRGRRTVLLRRGLVIVQVAVSVVLLFGAFLLVATFNNLLKVDPGFDSRDVVTVRLNIPAERYADAAAVRQVTTRILELIRGIPGVASAGLTSNIPMGNGGGWSPVVAEGYYVKPGESVVSPYRIAISPGYLEAMRTPLLSGRYFAERDDENAPLVMIVDQELAQRFWGSEDPVGRRMYRPTDPQDLNRTDENTTFYTVVGVVRKVQLRDLSGSGGRGGAYYLPHDQRSDRSYWIAIHAPTGVGPVLEALREGMRRIDPEMPLSDVQMMSRRVERSLGPRKLTLTLAGTFGVVTLLLAALGLYGVLTYIVSQRRRELGIRMALGSSVREVFLVVFSDGVRLVATGLLLGVLGTVVIGRVLEDQVYGVSPADPRLILGIVLFTAVIALIACVYPARSAMRVDPVAVLNDR